MYSPFLYQLLLTITNEMSLSSCSYHSHSSSFKCNFVFVVLSLYFYNSNFKGFMETSFFSLIDFFDRFFSLLVSGFLLLFKFHLKKQAFFDLYFIKGVSFFNFIFLIGARVVIFGVGS